MIAQTLFITGTDTDIGKTMVTACLAKGALQAGQRVAIFKPVQTGVEDVSQGDAAWCAEQLQYPKELHIETMYCFTPPVAPTVADVQQHISILAIQQRFMELCEAFDVVLVEGAGGVLCPLTPQATMADLARQLSTPTVLVTRRTLGTLNHTLCAFEALRHRKVEVHAVLTHDATPLREEIACSLAVRTLMPELQRCLGGEVPLHFLPYLEAPVALYLQPG